MLESCCSSITPKINQGHITYCWTVYNGLVILENTIYDPGTARPINGQSVTDPFPGNIIPMSRHHRSPEDPEFLPHADQQRSGEQLESGYKNPTFIYIPRFKLDHNFTERHHLSFFYSENRIDHYVNPDGLPIPVTQLRPEYERNRTMRLNYDFTVTPSLILHMGAGYVMYRSPDVAALGVLEYDAPGQLGLYGGIPNNFADPNITATGFPRMSGTSTGGYGMNLPLGPSNANKYAVDKPTGVLNVTWVRGNHTLKTGADWRIDAYRDRNVRGTQGIWTFDNTETGLPYLGSGSTGGGNLGSGYADFLLGLATSASVETPQDPQYRKTSWSLFLQDTWKVSRKLTLTYGMRWDLQNAWREIHDRIAEFSPTTPNPSVGGLLGATIYAGYGAGRCNCEFTSAYPYAIRPRLGVAYQIDSKTVFRAGWGLTYGTTSNSNYISNTSDSGRRLDWVQLDLVCSARLRTARRYLRPGFALYPGANVSDFPKRRNRSVPRAAEQPAVLDRSERWPAAAHQSMEYRFAAPVHGVPDAGGRLCRQSGRLAAGQQPGRPERSDAANSGRTRPEPFEFREPVASVIDLCVGQATSRRFQRSVCGLPDGVLAGAGPPSVSAVHQHTRWIGRRREMSGTTHYRPRRPCASGTGCMRSMRSRGKKN